MAKVGRRNSLPRGLAWPIATNDLRNSLGEQFDAVSLVWFSRLDERSQVSVRWTADSHRYPSAFAAHENSAAIWIAPSATGDAVAAGELIREVVLPEVVSWLTSAFAQDDERQSVNHAKWWAIHDGAVVSSTHDESVRHRNRSRF